MIQRESPVPDPLSVETFYASRPNIDAIRASDEERAAHLSLLSVTEREIIEELLAKRIVGASDLAIMIRTTVPKSKRLSEHCVDRFSELWSATPHATTGGRLEQDVRLAVAVGAVADAATIPASYRMAAAERFDRALESISDPIIPDETRVALGAFLVDRATRARESLPENLKN